MAPGDHRRVRFSHPEPLEELIYVGIGLQIQPGERYTVLGQEVADPEGVLRIPRADHSRARVVPDWLRSCRRAMNACRMTSPSSG